MWRSLLLPLDQFRNICFTNIVELEYHFLLLFVSGSLCVKPHHQNGCYKSDVILACPHYTQNKPGQLDWRFKDKTTGRWSKVASIKHGQTRLTATNTALAGRSAIHPNGSLEIHSLRPDDETQYMCIVKQGGRKLHVVKLSVACGKCESSEKCSSFDESWSPV